MLAPGKPSSVPTAQKSNQLKCNHNSDLEDIYSCLTSCVVSIEVEFKMAWCLLPSTLCPFRLNSQSFGFYYLLHFVYSNGIQSGIVFSIYCIVSIQVKFSHLVSSIFYFVFIQVDFKVVWCSLPYALCLFKWNSKSFGVLSLLHCVHSD